MATTLFRLSAVSTAILVMGLAACGGGSESSQPVQPTVSTAVAPFSGTAVDRGTDFVGQSRAKALSAPESAARPLITAATQVAAGEQRIEALAAAAVETRSTWDRLADYLETAYPELFPGHQESFIYPGTSYLVRQYVLPDGQKNYMGTAPDGRLYGHGQFTGYQLMSFGTVCEWATRLVDQTICGPRIMSARIVFDDGRPPIDARGATGVPAKGTRLEIVMSDLINCAGLNGTRVVGEFLLTIESCRGATLVLTPGLPGETRWPFGSTNALTLAGVRSLDGFPSPSEVVSFTTQAFASDLVFVGTAWGNLSADSVLSAIDLTGSVRPVSLDKTYGGGQFRKGSLSINRTAGVMYSALQVAPVLQRVDAATGRSLAAWPISPGSPLLQGITGADGSEREECVVLGLPGMQARYSERNKVVCWNHFTGERVFVSPADWVTDGAKISFALHYSVFHRRYYSINATEAALLTGTYLPGMPGTVTEISCERYPCQLTRTFAVGSVPQAIAEDERGTLYVVNSGDKSLSIITPADGNVVTRGLPMFTGEQFPVSLHYHSGRLLMGDYERSIVVVDARTLVQVQRIPTGANQPWGMATIGSEVWVGMTMSYSPGPLVDTGYDVVVFDAATLALRRTIANVGPGPIAILSAR